MLEDQNQCPACFERRQPNVPCACGYDEEQSVPGLPLPPGTSLMRQPGVVAYRLGRVLGAGTFGITYLAWDVARNVRVAIKEYIPREIVGRSGGTAIVRLHTQRDAAAFEAGLTRFVQEADALRQFRHPNIVNVLDFVNSNDTAYLVMPFYVGRTLGQYLDEHKRMETAPALRIILSILDGLRHVHEKHLGGRRWMHRDVKPDNIFVRGDDTPLLIDFGAARTEIGAASRSMSRIFTAGYAPYEQIILGPEHQGPWIDVYAAAATLYHTITGVAPADAPRRHLAVQKGDPDPLVRPRDIVSDLPEAVDNAIVAGMAIDYQDRPQDAGDFQHLLESAKQAIPPRKTALMTESPDRPPAIRTTFVHDKPALPRKVLIAAGLAAMVAIAIVVSLTLWSDGRTGSSNAAQGAAPPSANPAAPGGTAPPPEGTTPAAGGITVPPGPNPVQPIENRDAGARGEGTPAAPSGKTPAGPRDAAVPQRSPDPKDAAEKAKNNPPSPPPRQQRPDTPVGGGGAGPQQIADETTVVVAYTNGKNPGLRYRLLQELQSGRVVNVDPESTFHSGDKVRFVFEANIEGHLYILQRGSAGNWGVLFPSPRINGGQNMIRAFQAYTVPPTGWFRFDDNPGDESIRVFLSKNPLNTFPELEQVVVKQQTVQNADVERALLKSRELVFVEDKSSPTDGPPGNIVASPDSATEAITITFKLIHR